MRQGPFPFPHPCQALHLAGATYAPQAAFDRLSFAFTFPRHLDTPTCRRPALPLSHAPPRARPAPFGETTVIQTARHAGRAEQYQTGRWGVQALPRSAAVAAGVPQARQDKNAAPLRSPPAARRPQNRVSRRRREGGRVQRARSGAGGTWGRRELGAPPRACAAATPQHPPHPALPCRRRRHLGVRTPDQGAKRGGRRHGRPHKGARVDARPRDGRCPAR